VLLPDEPAAAAMGFSEELAAGVEVADGADAVVDAGVVVAAADDFLLVFAVDESTGLAIGVSAAGCVVSALADFLALLLFVAVVVSEAPVAAAGPESALEPALADFFVLPLFVAVVLSDAPAGADAAVESVLADFLLLFFVVVLSDDVAVPAEVEL
jgi:hypothetical protein